MFVWPRKCQNSTLFWEDMTTTMSRGRSVGSQLGGEGGEEEKSGGVRKYKNVPGGGEGRGGEGRGGQGRTGQDRAGQGRAGEGREGKGRGALECESSSAYMVGQSSR